MYNTEYQDMVHDMDIDPCFVNSTVVDNQDYLYTGIGECGNTFIPYSLKTSRSKYKHVPHVVDLDTRLLDVKEHYNQIARKREAAIKAKRELKRKIREEIATRLEQKELEDFTRGINTILFLNMYCMDTRWVAIQCLNLYCKIYGHGRWKIKERFLRAFISREMFQGDMRKCDYRGAEFILRRLIKAVPGARFEHYNGENTSHIVSQFLCDESKLLDDWLFENVWGK